MSDLQKLFEPVAIGRAVMRNRFAMLAMGTNFGANVNDAVKAYYLERAKGGVGLIIVGGLDIVDMRELHPEQISMHDDALIPGFRELTKALHGEGAKTFAQLLPSMQWRPTPEAPLVELGPSDVKVIPSWVPRPATIEEIHLITTQIADAARRAREAGFDGVELHAGTGVEIFSPFLSSLTNRRTDEYGGSLENRARFLVETIAAMKVAVGADYPITVKMSGDDFMKGGNTLEDAKQVARLLQKAGVDGLNVAAGWHQAPMPFAVSSVPEGGFVYLATAVKEVVTVPVIGTYRITDPRVAASIIAEGKADLVGMGRALLADPYLPAKVKAGMLDEVRPCLSCCRCLDEAFNGRPVQCSVNPLLGRESEHLLEPARAPKKVFVAGGGPGGMQAAITAASRGHDVTLFERGPALGGELQVATVPPHKSQIGSFSAYLSREAAKAGVKLNLNQELTADLVEQQRPDAVIVAVGATPIILKLPGIDSEKVVAVRDVLGGSRPVGKKVAIIGGGMVGCETALYLAARGCEVIIVEMLDKVANDVGPSNRWAVRQELKKAGVTLLTSAKAQEIVPQGLVAKIGDETRLIEADTIVQAVGARASRHLAEQLEGKCRISSVGDCIAPRLVREAIQEGFRAGAQV